MQITDNTVDTVNSNWFKTIKTNQLYTKETWDDIVENNGGWNDGCVNINMKYSNLCPFFLKKDKNSSQNGEEGIIDSIFEKIGFTNKKCVDIGAWDGKHLSNTYFLKKKYEFNRLLIEGCNNKKIHDDCNDEKLTHSLVSSNNINTLLNDIPDKFDFLCIDIDGDDYWVLNAMEKKARVVILEYASGVPNFLPLVCKEGYGTVKSFTGEPITNGYYGANMLAFGRLMKNKGYEFVTSLSDNMFFVIKEEFYKLGIEPISEKDMIDKYYNASAYWGVTHRDKFNNDWIIVE